MALEPEIILFDEPTSALGPELVGEVLGAIRKIAGDGATMMIVTHELVRPRHVQHVVFMAGGQEIEEGHSYEVSRQPKLERTRRFLSSILPPS